MRKSASEQYMKQNIRVVTGGAPLVSEIDQWVRDRLQQAIDKNGTATIALAGGSTPKVVYQALSKAQFAWDKLHVFWGDERFVPPSHPDSNEKMARENWLDLVPIPAANIHPWPTEAGTPEQCAELYGAELTKYFAAPQPSFDLVLLGMGEDGHTASLFPHTAALGVMDRSTTVGQKDGQPRLTLTVPAINNAACVAFIITGASKRPALQQVMATTADSQEYPTRLIQPTGELIWWFDEAAAADLANLG
jgi:6-phosphogluconolactonase